MEKPGITPGLFYCHRKRLKINGCVIGTFKSGVKLKFVMITTYTTFVVFFMFRGSKKIFFSGQNIYLRLLHGW